MQAVLSNPDLQLLERLAKIGPLQTFLFGDTLRGGETLSTAARGSSRDTTELDRLRTAIVTRNGDSHTRLADALAELLAERIVGNAS